MSSDVNKTLDERGERYGKFRNHAELSQKLKQEMKKKATWWDLSPSQQESLEMIANKIARILNGDPNYADNWHDIAGYATLIDLQGACLMPGLIDPHAHIVSGALDGLLLDLSPPNPAPLVQGQPQAYDIAWVQGQLQQAVNAADPTNGWVLAAGFDASKLTSWVNLTSRWFAENMHNPNGIPIIVQAG